MNLFFEYINYRWNAKGRHGIHSPFVYDFVDKCLKLKINESDDKQRRDFFSYLKSLHHVINVEDFGAGSKHFKNQRKVSDLFYISSSKGRYGKLLYQLVKFYQPKKILEFGTSMGVGSFMMSIAKQDAEITTVEACKNTHRQASDNLQKMNVMNVQVLHSTFEDFLKQNQQVFDLIFIDGHHDGEALKQYLKQLKPFSHNDTIFVLDDIRWSKSMKKSFDEIISDENYHLTLDLFRMGIVIPRNQQVKEHFIIKI